MAVLAKNANVALVGTGTKISVPCGAADIFYEGAVVWVDETSPTATVSPITVAPATGDRILGICARQVTTTAEGDLVDVYIDGTFAIAGMSVTRNDIGDLIVFDAGTTITDNPADAVAAGDITTADNDAILGVLVSYYDSTAYVRLGGLTGQIKMADANAIGWEW